MTAIDILTNDAAKYRIGPLNQHTQRLVKIYAMMVYSDSLGTNYVASPSTLLTEAAAAFKGADSASVRAGELNVWIQTAIGYNAAAKTDPNDILPLVKALQAKPDQELDAIMVFLLVKCFQLA